MSSRAIANTTKPVDELLQVDALTPISNNPNYKFGCFTPSQSLLSFTAYQLWDWCGDCGINSASPETLIDCFDILSHSSGVLCYRLKSKLPDKPTIVDIYATFFQDIVLYDPMENLIYSAKDAPNKCRRGQLLDHFNILTAQKDRYEKDIAYLNKVLADNAEEIQKDIAYLNKEDNTEEEVQKVVDEFPVRFKTLAAQQDRNEKDIAHLNKALADNAAHVQQLFEEIQKFHYENYGDKDKTVTVVITHEKSGELYVMEPYTSITEDDWRKNHMKPETTLYRRTKVHGLRLLAPAKSSIMKSWY